MPILGPTCKHCRRFGVKLCSKPVGKCASERRRAPRGRGSGGMPRLSEYGQQLREKQKAKFVYGVNERQFRNYYRSAVKCDGVTGDTLVTLLEKRFDNVIYRLGFASSRAQARQGVSHGHFQINGAKVDIPSYQIKSGDKVTWHPRTSKKSGLLDFAKEGMSSREVPEWLNRNEKEMTGEVVAMPSSKGEELGLDTRMIVEFYSRR